MNIVVTSMFRNAQRYIDRYFTKIDSLDALLRAQGHTLFLNLAHGDSRDDTGQMLQEACAERELCLLQEVNHGGKEYGPVEDSDRFRNLAQVCNAMWSHLPVFADTVLYLESDLIWEADTLLKLLDNHKLLRSLSSNMHQHMILAPMVYTRIGSFYDTWAFRKNGFKFTPESPYHPALQDNERLIEMDSVGSVFCIDAPLAFRLTWPESDVVVGLCRTARRLGAKIFVDKMLRVYHP